jgi:hypothetical protein
LACCHQSDILSSVIPRSGIRAVVSLAAGSLSRECERGQACASGITDIDTGILGRSRLDTTIDRIEAWACSLPLPTPAALRDLQVRTREYAAVG